MSRLLATGSRDWKGTQCQQRMESMVVPTMRMLYQLYMDEPITLVHGGARGADTMFARLWKDYFPNSRPERHNADWDTYGKAAGHIRNKEMVDLGADLCLAFPIFGAENKGTGGCVKLARAAGIPTIIIWDDGKRHEL